VLRVCVAALALAALTAPLVGCGGTRTVTVQRTVTVGDSTLPDPVDRTRLAIAAAAERRDWQALERLVPDAFRYSFGGETPGGAVAYWRQLERRGDEHPLATLAAIMHMPYTLSHGLYVWPFAYDTSPGELTPYERKLLAPIAGPKEIAGWIAFGGYIGWRAGIAPDGRWVFYVAGD
jgi:hypothetical protein